MDRQIGIWDPVKGGASDKIALPALKEAKPKDKTKAKKKASTWYGYRCERVKEKKTKNKYFVINELQEALLSNHPAHHFQVNVMYCW